MSLATPELERTGGAAGALAADFRLSVRFLTGRCVAAAVDVREQAEWPPHPGRLFMALAAAFFETDGSEEDKEAEKRALDWLASLPPPRITAVEAYERTPVTCYVPVNDAPQPNKAMLQSAPGMSRSRQSRTFPTRVPLRADSGASLSPDVTFEWGAAPGREIHSTAFERLCREVIRIGHSSSLAMVWIDEGGDSSPDRESWEPTDAEAELTCRIATAGELERLEVACQADRIDLFARLKDEVETTSGKAQAAAKKRFLDAFGEPYKASVRPPEPVPVTLGNWQGYRRRGATASLLPVENECFERSMLVLGYQEGPVLNVERTLGLTLALRAAALAQHGETAMPTWLTGHEPDGSPTTSPHVAFLALPFTGHRHADGHIMGLAIALPRGVSVAERGRWLGPLLIDPESGAPRCIDLWGKQLPDCSWQLSTDPSPARTLRNATWTEPATTWASVTPVVLDRFPKASRVEERAIWHAEVVEIVKLACKRGGLPEPVEVDIDSTAWHRGVPRAWAKTRRLREGKERTTAPLGDGFPLLPGKPSRPAKPQVHVWLRFAQPVAGPVLIGAGRFLGYGLCKPLNAPGDQ